MSSRIRRHANPFRVQTQLGRIDRLATFGREADLEVELGSGTADFLFARARNHPDVDFIGLEVRRPLVDQAMERRYRQGPENVVLFWANANVNLELAEPGVVRCFHCHFPDPCFKKKHQKRRMLQPQTVRQMSCALPIGGRIYAQSDVQPLAEEMHWFLEKDGALESLLGPSLLVPRPIEESTKWERHHENAEEPVYRMLFEKVREPEGQVPDLPFRDTREPKEV